MACDQLVQHGPLGGTPLVAAERLSEVSLPDELGPELWKKYQALVGAEVAESLERTSPSIAVLALVVMYEVIGATLDAEIERKVIAANIPTRGLESAEFQVRLLNQILDLRMLRASIQHTEDRAELANESEKDLSEYCAGTDDQPGMNKDTRDELLASGYTVAEIDRIDELRVYKRNEDWIAKLEKILAPGDVFVAVGADHLHGPRGVVQMLEKRGFKLTRITK